MIKHALFVRLEAKPGKEQEVSQFLQTGLGMAQQEGTTPVWFALQLGPSTFGIFDAFADEAGRQAHLKGPIAQALGANASRLLAQAPTIERIDVLGTKLPGTSNQQTPEASATGVAMNLEVHVIPVSAVERSKQFYQRLGWRLDDDVAPTKEVRIIQFTPPGSAVASMRVTCGTARHSPRRRGFPAAFEAAHGEHETGAFAARPSRVR